MYKKHFSVLFVWLTFAVACFGQQDGVVFLDPQGTQQPHVEFKPVSVGREERTAINFGYAMGGGGPLVGADFEFLIGKRLGFQIGTGIPTFGLGFNYHFKPYINSSFTSLQYNHIGFGERHIGATVGPMITFRAKKIFQAGAGWGAVVSKGPLWEDSFNEEVSMLIYFNIGLYFPL